MTVVKRIVASVFLVGCLLGTGFVVWDTWQRGTPSVDIGPEDATIPTPPTSEPVSADKFPISVTKNPFTPLVQLPPTATTQPPS